MISAGRAPPLATASASSCCATAGSTATARASGRRCPRELRVSDGFNVLEAPCDTVLWPALLTDGAPIAGPGVNPTLLGTVTRADVLPGESVQRVTCNGLPLYRSFLDEVPGETEGADLFDPVTSPTGI